MKRVKVNLEFEVDSWDDVSRTGHWSVMCMNGDESHTFTAKLVTMQQGKTNTTYVRNLRRGRREMGLCTGCGGVPEKGFIRCTRCREYSNSMDKRNLKRLEARDG